MGLIVSGVFSLVGVGIVVFSFIEFWRAMDSTDWPQVAGEIVGSGIAFDYTTRDRYVTPIIRYKYMIHEKEYIGDRVAFGGTISTSARYPATLIADRYPMNRKIVLRVSPNDPKLCVLEPGVHWSTMFVVAFGAVFLTFSLRQFVAWGGLDLFSR